MMASRAAAELYAVDAAQIKRVQRSSDMIIAGLSQVIGSTPGISHRWAQEGSFDVTSSPFGTRRPAVLPTLPDFIDVIAFTDDRLWRL